MRSGFGFFLGCMILAAGIAAAGYFIGVGIVNQHAVGAGYVIDRQLEMQRQALEDSGFRG